MRVKPKPYEWVATEQVGIIEKLPGLIAGNLPHPSPPWESGSFTNSSW